MPTSTFTAGGLGWFVAAALGFAVGMYGVAEILANRLHTQEEYIAALPGVAIVPYFFAGGLFPITALPAALTVVAKLLRSRTCWPSCVTASPIHSGHGLHDIWGLSNTTTMAVLSMTYVAAFAIALTGRVDPGLQADRGPLATCRLHTLRRNEAGRPHGALRSSSS